jgi:hypothetical protein
MDDMNDGVQDRILDQIVLRCATYMFEHIVGDINTLEYSVVEKLLLDNGDWCVTLETPASKGYVFEFKYKKEFNRLLISTFARIYAFTLDHDLS